jgi:hypothetical protein
MTDDFIDQAFADLDEYYPGSKKKRKAVAKKDPEIVVSKNWDSNPTKRTLPNGKDVELFLIGSLASALGRPIITIRTWIKEGYLPSAPYRLPVKKDINGKDHQGRRLYSRAMIEAVIERFDKAGILETKRIDWSQHQHLSNEIAEAWSNIRADETKSN